MCNLSQGIKEDGIEIGKEIGKEIGEARLIITMYHNGLTPQQIADATDKKLEEVERIIKEREADIMKSVLLKDTTKEERIALIKEWIPAEDDFASEGMDLWDLYRDYINGEKEIAECNAAFSTNYMTERDLAEGKTIV